jgi:hypothetical protein
MYLYDEKPISRTTVVGYTRVKEYSLLRVCMAAMVTTKKVAPKILLSKKGVYAHFCIHIPHHHHLLYDRTDSQYVVALTIIEKKWGLPARLNGSFYQIYCTVFLILLVFSNLDKKIISKNNHFIILFCLGLLLGHTVGHSTVLVQLHHVD